VEKRKESGPMTSPGGTAAERIVIVPEERRDAVLAVIDSARERLDLSLFRCDDDVVLDALAAAVRRRVRVRALLTARAKGSKAQLKGLRKQLQSTGVDVRRYSDPVVRYHAKYLVADDGPAVIASLNFTRKCFTDTCDFLLVSTDPHLVGALVGLFEGDWHGRVYVPGNGDGDRLIVGPEQARARFAALLDQATRTIRIIDPKISDPAILRRLQTKMEQGVSVEIRGPRDVGALMPHGKLLMVDDGTAVIGSVSLATLALEFRRELAVIIHDVRVLDALDGFWKSLPVPDSAATLSVLPQEQGL
jgi:phosphatidylserine/phosphatidylglycerophosphate/cardiolipin synthase-like enzyme